MGAPPSPLPGPDRLVSHFWDGTALRSRGVGGAALVGTVDVPAPPARLVADWGRDIAGRAEMEPGDVETLPLARARMRWPDYRQCVAAMEAWTAALGLGDALAAGAEVALMACRGARYHHDGALYGGAAFCNLFLSDDLGWDLHFPGTGQRLPLVRGTAVVFDTCQPHAVIRRGGTGFDAADFADCRGGPLVFLTWELPILNADVARVLGVRFDIDPAATGGREEDEGLWLDGAPARVCADSGRWCMPTAA